MKHVHDQGKVNGMTLQGTRVIVHGTVQGVGFRYFTAQKAMHLGLTGHAINLPNGDVEVQAFGDADALEQLTLWLNHGPEMASVESIDVSPIAYKARSVFTTG